MITRMSMGRSRSRETLTNFVEAIRNGEKLNAEIGEGQVSTLLCHLANMAWRSGSTVDFDPAKRSIVDNSAAGKLWARELA
mgnify:CR=1 FL=1